MLLIFLLEVILYNIWKMCVLLQLGVCLCFVSKLQEAYVLKVHLMLLPTLVVPNTLCYLLG